MKSLYCLLLRLSLSEPSPISSAPLRELKYELERCGFKEKVQDVGCLVEFLFQELDRRFEQLFSGLSHSSVNDVLEHIGKDEDLWATTEELILILRSCMVILTLVAFEFDQSLILEKICVLLSILQRLMSFVTSGADEKSSISLQNSFSHECTIKDVSSTTLISEKFVASVCFLEPFNPYRPFLSAVLEAFADELLTHRSLREYLKQVGAASFTELFFIHKLVCGDMGSVLEVIISHFILSVSDEQALCNFLNKLCWAHSKDCRAPELSLTPAITLLLNPFMLSTPKMLHAHFISLVSEAMGTVFCKNVRPDPRLMDYYLAIFERSFLLYSRHMSTLQMDNSPTNSHGYFFNSSKFSSNFQPPFESYIQPTKRQIIDDLISKSRNYWASYSVLRSKSDLLAGSVAYLEENQHVLDESCKDDILSILHNIVLTATSDDNCDAQMYKKGESSADDVYLLASILKLMSGSLLSAIWCIRHGGKSGSLQTLKATSSCKEYDFIMHIISHFREFDVCLPNQTFLCDVMKTHPLRHKDSKWMLLHFSGLLALSFVSEIDFLVKNCISIVMAVLNLFIFEEGDLVALVSLPGSGSEQLSWKSSLAKEEALAHQKSTRRVALKFQKIQTLFSSSDSVTESTVGLEEETEETCSGEILVRCLLEDPENSSSYDDIADFVEFKQGKDYFCWWKNRQRYRKWKSQKLAVLRWKKNKRIWKIMNGKKA